MKDMSTDEWRRLGISKSKAEIIAKEVIEVMKKYNVSLNQAAVILDSVKNDLNDKPLWSSHCQ